MGNGDQREVDVLLETHFLRVGLALVGGKCFMHLFLNMGIKVEETPTCFLEILYSVDFQGTRWGPGPEPGRGTFCGQIRQACGSVLMGNAAQQTYMETSSTSNVPLGMLCSLKLCTPPAVHGSIRNLFGEVDLNLISPIWTYDLLLILECRVMLWGHVP